MTRISLTFAAGAFALAAATGALAQQSAQDPKAAAQPAGQMGAPQGDQAASAASAGVNASTTDAPGGVEMIRQGDNILVTNGPVPDTKANRAKYGQPLSQTGRMTKPAGN
jgi:hypothetical protein